MQELGGKHAVVTGGGSGIGRAIAVKLSSLGAKVTLLGRNMEPLQSLAQTDAQQYCPVAADVTDPEQVAQALQTARERFGRISILVNNAGQAQSASFQNMDMKLWNEMLATNLTSVYLVTQAVLPDMVAAKWGRIVNVASSAGLKGYRYVSAYCASKHGVIGLTRSLALEVAKQGVTVNAVCPGYTDTPLLRESVARIVAATGRSPEQALDDMTRDNPQGRLILPEEVAQTVAWLCGENADAVHGQAVAVDGGELMH